MNALDCQVLETRAEPGVSAPRTARKPRPVGYYAIYLTAIAASAATWLLAIRCPLGLDETGSYWQICAGLSQIWPRQFLELAFPGYAYILWLCAKLLGTSEAALRIPSLLAMGGAAYLLYRAARELFERDIALIATLMFCLDPIVMFEAVDVRPYAFAVLVINAGIFTLLRLRRSESCTLAAVFGALASLTLYFHYLFATALPAFLLCAIAFKFRSGGKGRKQLAMAFAGFCIAFLPLIPGLRYLFHTAHSHVYEPAPNVIQLIWTIALGWTAPCFALVGLISVARTRFWQRRPIRSAESLVCGSLGMIPILMLYGLSAGTSIHMFAERHRLAAVPGLALCWALVLTRVRRPGARLLFAMCLVLASVGTVVASGKATRHYDSWNEATQALEKFTAADHAPVMITSAFIESDFNPMPADVPQLHAFFAPLSYYRISSPVVPLPEDFNGETIRVGSAFLQKAARSHQRFLVATEIKSRSTAQWIEKTASPSYTYLNLGRFGPVELVEFVPRAGVTMPSR